MIKLTLIQGDALKVLPKLPSESVDLVLTDPPYNLGKKYSKPLSIHENGKIDISTIAYFDNFKTEADYIYFLKTTLSEMSRICKRDANFVIFIDWRYISLVINEMEERGWRFRNVFAWVKKNPVPNIRRNFSQGLEIAIWLARGKNTFNKQFGYRPNYMVLPVNEKAYIPTQKHTEVVKTLIKYLSNENGIVLDPFLGSGTTMLACMQLKRNCIGIEILQQHINIIKKRLNWGNSLGDVQFEFFTEEQFVHRELGDEKLEKLSRSFMKPYDK